MTKKTRSGIMTKKPRSGIGREVSAYFAPNYHLCQNYTESGSFLTVHKNIKASIHKNMSQIPFGSNLREAMVEAA